MVWLFVALLILMVAGFLVAGIAIGLLAREELPWFFQEPTSIVVSPSVTPSATRTPKITPTIRSTEVGSVKPVATPRPPLVPTAGLIQTLTPTETWEPVATFVPAPTITPLPTETATETPAGPTPVPVIPVTNGEIHHFTGYAEANTGIFVVIDSYRTLSGGVTNENGYYDVPVGPFNEKAGTHRIQIVYIKGQPPLAEFDLEITP
jgi:hypothetical protein